MGLPLWFIAVLPDAVIQEEVTAFKMEAKERYKSKHALKSPPHITLIPPFRWPESDIGVVREIMEKTFTNHGGFELKLEGFDRFGERVIFVAVAECQTLSRLQSDLKGQFADALGIRDSRYTDFHPHMTVAFKDLKKADFADAWSWFSSKTYSRTFEVNQLFLFRHHNGRWQVQD
ncbi:MAG: 2'-5' RNA ligase family protein [Bacteroidetes bacterium]|nr:2'-5' RNA ligase family protein [Bacteroidota bacterium]